MRHVCNNAGGQTDFQDPKSKSVVRVRRKPEPDFLYFDCGYVIGVPSRSLGVL